MFRILLLASLCVLACLVSLAPARAQARRAEAVRFESRDGVKLYGQYYRGRGRSSPCVLMVHELGKSSRIGPWKDLAAALNAKGLAVLAFDLRGHGFSTTVDETEFWLPRYHNRNLVRLDDPEVIDFQDFDARYDQYLINDLAAAKGFLERRSNLGECNASNLVLIAAGSGATLSVPWINAEWHRHELVPSGFPGMPPQVDRDSEGVNFLGVILVSPATKLGGRDVNLAAMLDLAGRHGKMPLTILHGERDAVGKRRAVKLTRKLQVERDLPFTGALPVPGSGTLKGARLLHKRFGMGKQIAKWIETLSDERGREWREREHKETLFVWRAPHNFRALIPAKRPGDRDLFVDSYQRFVR